MKNNKNYQDKSKMKSIYTAVNGYKIRTDGMAEARVYATQNFLRKIPQNYKPIVQIFGSETSELLCSIPPS